MVCRVSKCVQRIVQPLLKGSVHCFNFSIPLHLSYSFLSLMYVRVRTSSNLMPSFPSRLVMSTPHLIPRTNKPADPSFYVQNQKSVRAETYCLPSLKLTTAHLPPQAHLRAPLSPPPPSVALSSSSLPLGRPTTTSALTVRKERIRRPEPGPRGPMAVGKGVVGSQRACGRYDVSKVIRGQVRRGV